MGVISSFHLRAMFCCCLTLFPSPFSSNGHFIIQSDRIGSFHWSHHSWLVVLIFFACLSLSMDRFKVLRLYTTCPFFCVLFLLSQTVLTLLRFTTYRGTFLASGELRGNLGDFAKQGHRGNLVISLNPLSVSVCLFLGFKIIKTLFFSDS